MGDGRAAGPVMPSVMLMSHSGQLAGAEFHVAGIAEEFWRRGAATVVVVPEDGPLQRRLADVGVTTMVIPFKRWAGPSKSLKARLRAVARNLVATVALVRLIRAERPSVVITNTMAAPPIAAVAARLTRTPHLWFVTEQGTEDHGVHFDWGRSRSLRIIGRSGMVLAICAAVADALSPEVTPSRIRAVDPVVLVPKDPAQSQVGASAGMQLQILTVGMKNRGKHQEDLVRALGTLTDAGRDVAVTLIGWEEPAYVAHLAAVAHDLGVSDRLAMLPFTEDIHGAYAAAHVHVTCSRHEALGSATIEAMAHGLPVVGARSGGTPEIVEEGRTGFLYDPDDVAGLAAALGRIDDDRAAAAAIGARGRTAVEGRFTPAAVVDQLLGVMAEVSADSQ